MEQNVTGMNQGTNEQQEQRQWKGRGAGQNKQALQCGGGMLPCLAPCCLAHGKMGFFFLSIVQFV